MPNFNEKNQVGEFCSVFKEVNRNPSASSHALTIIKQVQDTADEINRLKGLLEQANHLMINGKNLSLEYRQKLKCTVETTTEKLAEAEARFKKMINPQTDQNSLLGRS